MKKIIGLTGSIASGKSTVSNILKDMGYLVVDCDDINHRLLKKARPGYNAVLEEFGEEILDEHGQIDRKKLGKLVFNDNKLKEKYAKSNILIFF